MQNLMHFRTLLISLLTLLLTGISLSQESPGSNPSEIQIIASRGTGQTTGHIATLTVRNTSARDIEVRPQIFFIPSDGKYQSYVGKFPGGISIPSGSSGTIPVYGYCADISRPPVPPVESMPSPDSWLPVESVFTVPTATGDEGNPFAYPKFDPSAPSNMPPPLKTFVNILPKQPLSPFSHKSIPVIQGSKVYEVRNDSTPSHPDLLGLYPGTTTLIPGNFHPERDPEIFAPVAVEALLSIERVVPGLQDKGALTTPFSPDPDKEAFAVTQQTFWLYLGVIKGEPYEEKDFKEQVYEQFSLTTGVSADALPEDQKEGLDDGVAQFWNAFTATGIEAKVLRQKDNPDQVGDPDPTIPELISEDKCDCGDVSLKANLTIASGEEEGIDFSTKLMDQPGGGKAQRVIVDAESDAAAGSAIRIKLSDIETECGKCKNRNCKAGKPKLRVVYGELEADNSSRAVTTAEIVEDDDDKVIDVTMPEGTKDVGFFITVEYTCEDRNCGAVDCSAKFLLKVKRRGKCNCGESFLTTEVKINNDMEEFTFTGDAYTSPIAVTKDDKISITINAGGIQGDCSGCGGNCASKDFEYKIFGEKIDGLKTEDKADWEDYSPARKAKLLSYKKVTGDRGDAVCHIHIRYNCEAGADCDPSKCEKKYSITFKRR